MKILLLSSNLSNEAGGYSESSFLLREKLDKIKKNKAFLFGFWKSNLFKLSYKMTDKINMRHHEFHGKIAEHRVWSIRFFDSFVVFDINKEALAQKSKVTSNNGYSDGAIDYRYSDKRIFYLFQSLVRSIVKKFSFLKKFKVVRWSYSLIMHGYNLNLIRLFKLFRSFKTNESK